VTAADRVLVDAAQLRRHAGNLQTLRDRFDAVQSASASIAYDDAAFGMLCSWLPAMLAARHRRQDELVAYLSENLALLSDDLHAAATDYEGTDTRSASAIRAAGGSL